MTDQCPNTVTLNYKTENNSTYALSYLTWQFNCHCYSANSTCFTIPHALPSIHYSIMYMKSPSIRGHYDAYIGSSVLSICFSVAVFYTCGAYITVITTVSSHWLNLFTILHTLRDVLHKSIWPMSVDVYKEHLTSCAPPERSLLSELLPGNVEMHICELIVCGLCSVY